MLDCDRDTIKYINECIAFYNEYKDHPERCTDLEKYQLGHEFLEHEKMRGMFFKGYDCCD